MNELGSLANPWGAFNSWDSGVDLVKELEAGGISLEQFRTELQKVFAAGGEYSGVAGEMDFVAAELQEIAAEIARIETIDLTGAGRKIANSLANGIRAGTPDVRAAASEAAATVKDYFPHSPAKYGPLRTLSGRGTVEQLAGTMNPAPLTGAAERLAGIVADQDMQFGMPRSPGFDSARSGIPLIESGIFLPGSGAAKAMAAKILGRAPDEVPYDTDGLSGHRSPSPPEQSSIGGDTRGGGHVTLHGDIVIHVTGNSDPEATARAVEAQLASEMDAVLGD